MPRQKPRAIEILPIAVGAVSWAAPLDPRVTLGCETKGVHTSSVPILIYMAQRMYYLY